jgi:ribosomal protein S12 methylthiotransferase accessory factor
MVPAGDIYGLLQPRGGLFGAVLRFQGQCDEPRLITQVAQSGDVGQVWPHVRRKHGLENSRPAVTGAGTGLEDDEPRLLALAEGLERYCACVYRKEQFTWATADELGNEALDLDTLPKCSEKELSHPRCPLMAPDKKARIRWVRGISLLDGRLVHIPAVMVYLYTGVANPGERFWLPITTGCAAHTTYERALLSAILEVIERDAISIIWLQKLSLPRLELDRMPPTLAHYWDRYQRSSRDLEYVFFDATTGVGVPIVYGLQIAREDTGRCYRTPAP